MCDARLGLPICLFLVGLGACTDERFAPGRWVTPGLAGAPGAFDGFDAGESDDATSAGGDAGEDAPPPPVREVSSTAVRVILDPYGEAPLSALLLVDLNQLALDSVSRVAVSVAGRDGAPDLTAELNPETESFRSNYPIDDLWGPGELGIPVLGLYANADNAVTFTLGDQDTLFRGQVTIETRALSADHASVRVAEQDRMALGLTYLNRAVYDHRGRLRWSGPEIWRIARNGNILTSDLREVTWLGKTVQQWTLPSNMTVHHDTIELPNGNIVTCVLNRSTDVVTANGTTVTSADDYVVELDRGSNIENAWDLREFLDVSRATVSNRETDWLHMNTLAYDEHDDSIIVSGRYQGIVKLTRGGTHGERANEGKELVWILSPQLGFELAGWDGTGPIDPTDYLLLALDSEGIEYPVEFQENLVSSGTSPDDFHWPIGQHGIAITATGDGRLSFLTFDNQASVIFDGVDTINNGVTWTEHGDFGNDRSTVPYSAIIEYEVDEQDMTVRQLWSFGAYDTELYGSYNGGVNWFSTNGNRLMISNGVNNQDSDDLQLEPHVVEVTARGEVVYHLVVDPGDKYLSAYRAGRVDLYHPAEAR